MFQKMKKYFIILYFAVVCFLCVPVAFAQPAIPSLGSGAYEVILFADYFCPPCKRIDTKAEALLKELLATGSVKITFVDVPFNRLTPMYVKYYLYAANASGEANNILHVRKILFEAAQEKRIEKEDALVAYLKSKKIALKPMDEKSVHPLLSAAIKVNKIENTPTCIVRYSMLGEKKYVGDIEIWDGLTQLKSMLMAGGKK